MTSIIMNLINDTLRVFLMQYKDGIGCLYHVVFMVIIFLFVLIVHKVLQLAKSEIPAFYKLTNKF